MSGQQTTGLSNDFDDLILDPEGAAEGPAMSQTNQGYEESPDVEGGEKDAAIEEAAKSAFKGSREKIETFDNINPDSNLKSMEDKEAGDEKDPEGKSNESRNSKEGEEKKDEPISSKENEGEKGKEGTEENKEAGKETSETGKSLRLFKDNNRYEIPPDAEMRVKVAGKYEKVPLSVLRDNYSGKVAYDEKFTEISEREKSFEAKEKEVTRVQESIKNTLDETRSSLAESLKEGGNPMDAINKIVDLLGVDSYDFNKALFDAQLEELVLLDSMDEIEQKAYWLEKRNDYQTKRHESLEEKRKQSEALEERRATVDRMREAHGVSEEDFVSAYDELSRLGRPDATPQQVVQYAVNLPFMTKAESMLKPYEEQLSDKEMDSMMAKVAVAMRDHGYTEDDMTAWLANHYEVEDLINDVNDKASKIGADKKNDKTTRVPSQSEIYNSPVFESFDDF